MNILFELFRGEWFIEQSYAKNYMPLLNNIIRGRGMREVLGREKEPLQVRYAFEVSASNIEGEVLLSNGLGNDIPEGAVAVIPIKGVMTKYGTMCEYGTLEISKSIMEAADNPKIAGIVLDTDTGGGSGNSIPPLTEAIEYAKKKKGVVCYADMIASAGYYAGCFAHKIVMANELSSAAGSIGVYTMLIDNKEYFEKQGLKIHEIYPPESNYKNKEYKDAFDGNYESLISEVLSPMAQRFQEVVRQNREGKLKEKTEGLLNGKMFRAADAVKIGLADKIGSLQMAIKMARDLTEVNKFMKK
jgi:protease-4